MCVVAGVVRCTARHLRMQESFIKAISVAVETAVNTTLTYCSFYVNMVRLLENSCLFRHPEDTEQH